jgi:hypothetical protein
MNKLELFFTAVFVIGTVATLILIYFYNKRHKLIIKDEIDDFVVEKKHGEKALYKSSDKFDWDVYDSDLNFDHEKFFGYDLWKNREAAEKRIAFLRESYHKDGHSLKINMLESMLLVDAYGEDVTLDNEGVYRAKKILIDNFLEELSYDMDMIDKIANLREELEFSVENYEVDAKKIFYIMKQAKSFGLYNLNNHSQIFLFAKRHNKATVDADIVIEDDTGVSQLDIIIDDGISYLESNSYTEEVEAEAKPDIFSAFKKMRARTKSYIDADGNKITEYENGQKVIRRSLWELEVIEDEEEKGKFDEKNKKQSAFKEAITPDPVDKIMESSNQEPANAKKTQILEKQKTSVKESKQENIHKEVIVEKEKEFFQKENEEVDYAYKKLELNNLSVSHPL